MIAAAAMLRGRVALNPAALALGFVLLCTVLPLLRHAHLPLVDLPNHIARLHLAATASDGPMAQYFSYAFALVPNSAADLLWQGLGHPTEVERFAGLVMASAALNLVLGTMVLARYLHGRWTLWSAGVGLVVYNMAFLFGFQNFVWSLPFGLYALMLWLHLEPRATWLRVAVFVPVALALYLAHFFAFAFFAAMVLGREVQTLIEARGRGFARRFALALPFVLPLGWLIVSTLRAPPAASGSFTSWLTLKGWLLRWRHLLLSPDAALSDPINLLGLAATCLLGLLGLRLFARSGPRLVLDARMRGAVIALAAVSVLAPQWLNGVALVDIRAPVLLLAAIFAGTTWQRLSPRGGWLLAAVFAVLIAGRGLYFDRMAARYSADIEDMYSIAESLPAGARVLPLRAPGMENDRLFHHAQALLVARRDVYVPTLFQGVHALSLKPQWADHAHPALFSIDLRRALSPDDPDLPPIFLTGAAPEFARDWQRKYHYALLFDAHDPADPRLRPIARQGRMTLFAVHPGPGDRVAVMTPQARPAR
ncbi:hypothetical protein KO516_11195 [Citreicella sp. C3M06]|uniref:hypothetical protein n=1 Tax=Citreicella sp. C3M06 TaxID=2841564 RepID=UPI001C08259E|nr:hypothetical protein [Citreicella sp. C3M06]MBU2961374.1 hypothetical protein [Citreicella sp. C3M06]